MTNKPMTESEIIALIKSLSKLINEPLTISFYVENGQVKFNGAEVAEPETEEGPNTIQRQFPDLRYIS